MKRLALIEDNPDNRLLVQAILDGRYDIDEYENGLAALKGMAARPPGLVLMDISLPGMDGVQVLKEIRATANLKLLPVVALTAHAMAGDREKYMAEGFNGYITKPIIDVDQLITTIERLIQG